MAGTGWLTYADFADLIGDTFEVRGGDATLTLELVEATESTESGGPGPGGEQRQQFSLVFRGPADQVLAQGIRALAHPGLGDLALFLVPLGPDADGMRYEAAFA